MTESWLALHLAPGIGDRKKRVLVERLGGPEEVLRLSPEEVAAETACGAVAARRFVKDRPDVERVRRGLERSGAEILPFDDPSYPSLLKEIHDPPLVLFVKGDLRFLSRPTVGLVGARKADPGAAAWTEEMAFTLARSGFVVASGLARGIDAAAHRGALRAGGATTAILGTGPDVIYPPESADLGRAIAGSGVIATELPPGEGPFAGNFPRRNRILAGLSRAVVVVQASEKSGAMITARLALEASREVLVVAAFPWDPRFAGNRRLARDGAIVVQDGEEVALHLGATPPSPAERGRALVLDLEGLEREVAEVLAEGPRTADEICRAVRKSPAEILPLLLELEMGGLVVERPGKVFAWAAPR
ncbi:MAG: DNA-protecting protein DprA [Candidatus Eisenbacteria bacterium]|nr:DNA-protecting protein DprA [Candidatus Eisenbacteria bacterium]